MTCIELFWILIGPASAWGGWHIGKQWGPGVGALAALAAGVGPYALVYGLLFVSDYRRRKRAGKRARFRGFWDLE